MKAMSAPPIRVPRAPGEAHVVRPRMTARERLARIIQRRELLVSMVRKELKIKYKNSILGFAWSLLNPLLYLVVFYVAFTIISAPASRVPDLVAVGPLVWNLFSTGLRRTRLGRTNSAGQRRCRSARSCRSPVGSMLVHFFLQSLVLFTVLAACVASLGPIPLIPLASSHCCWSPARWASCRRSTCTCDTRTSSARLLAWFWIRPSCTRSTGRDPRGLVTKRGSPTRHADRLGVPGRSTRVDNKRRGPQLLPHWPYWVPRLPRLSLRSVSSRSRFACSAARRRTAEEL